MIPASIGQWSALGLVLAASVAAPAWLLRDPASTPAASHAAGAPATSLRPAPALDRALRRPLFLAEPLLSDGDPPADDDGISASAMSPRLVGIAGRLPHDAVAMVRAEDGRTRTLSIGDSIDGWQLAAVARDAALFVRGRERVRAALPPADAAPDR